ncbi:MAG TPA: hypothetical protein VIX37_23385 [Candidatus Sulfotelmatobacter sp.]
MDKIVDRLLRDLSSDVPQRLLDAGGGTVELQRAAPLRVVIERDLQLWRIWNGSRPTR